MKRTIPLILVLALVAAFAPGAASAALPRSFWGVVANEAPTPTEGQTLKAGGVESLRDAGQLGGGAVEPVRDARLELGRPDRPRRRRSRAHRPPLPHLAAALGGRIRRGRLRRRSAAQPAGADRDPARRLARIPPPRGLPLRPRRQLLGRKPAAARAADPDLADLERAELQILRRAARTRPSTASSSSSPTPTCAAPTPAPGSSSAASSSAPRAATASRSRA